MDLETYDEILDSLDDENIESLKTLFPKYKLDPHSFLFDLPRTDDNNNELYTYLDYVISHSLNQVIEYFIDELDLEIDDHVMAKTIKLDNLEMYNLFCNMGYHPEGETLKVAVQKSCSQIVASILENDNELIDVIEDYDIEELFNHLDEETIETTQVLVNNGIDLSLFDTHLELLKQQTSQSNQSNQDDDNGLGDDEVDIAIELIDLLDGLNIAIE